MNAVAGSPVLTLQVPSLAKKKRVSTTMIITMNANNFDPIDEDSANVRRYFGMKKLAFISIAAATCGTAAASLYSNYQQNIVSTSSSLLGTRTSRKQGQSCGVFSSCDENLSCFTGGNSDYCVPNGKKGACCGIFSGEAAGIDCLSGLYCKVACEDGSVQTCNPSLVDTQTYIFAKEGTCNVNTGEPATAFINK